MGMSCAEGTKKQEGIRLRGGLESADASTSKIVPSVIGDGHVDDLRRSAYLWTFAVGTLHALLHGVVGKLALSSRAPLTANRSFLDSSLPFTSTRHTLTHTRNLLYVMRSIGGGLDHAGALEHGGETKGWRSLLVKRRYTESGRSC